MRYIVGLYSFILVVPCCWECMARPTVRFLKIEFYPQFKSNSSPPVLHSTNKAFALFTGLTLSALTVKLH